ncbi:hypothetical protein [Herbaspirillum sp. SJZ099]|uniref:hypothetical protein n=1 Tax=Herbaspirillum sp. SJZ099 TaxID=2572916 RepID=UPI0011A77B9F|nr:hypothetical protein [Herbaspirillum sp. SJZ099]TWC67290.1 hypothetical protein FB597_104100 [Herbaspirillum sp. SJZ099]
MFRSIPIRNTPPVGSADVSLAVVQSAPAPRPQAIRALFETLPPLQQQEMELAIHAYLQCGRSPNFDALVELRRAMDAIKEELIESDRLDGTDFAKPLFAHAEQSLAVDNDSPQAPQLLLSHLEATLIQYQRCDIGLRQDLTPQLHVALSRYLDLINDRHMQAPADDHTELEQRHEQTRNILFEPQRQRIVREFARRAAGDDGPVFDVFAHLGISPGYRASEQDREDFRALFESGRILRHKMVYTPPAECRKLYEQYAKEVEEAMRNDGIDGDLRDMIAVRTYTVSSNELNQALREQNLEVIDTFAPYFKTFVSGLANLRTSSSTMYPDADGFITLLRAVRLSEEELFRAGYVPGVVFRQPTPMSCSDNPNVSYWTLRGNYNVHIKVRCKVAHRTGEISRHAHSESEWIASLHLWMAVKSLRWLPGGTPSHPNVDLVFEECDQPRPAPSSAVR